MAKILHFNTNTKNFRSILPLQGPCKKYIRRGPTTISRIFGTFFLCYLKPSLALGAFSCSQNRLRPKIPQRETSGSNRYGWLEKKMALGTKKSNCYYPRWRFVSNHRLNFKTRNSYDVNPFCSPHSLGINYELKTTNTNRLHYHNLSRHSIIPSIIKIVTHRHANIIALFTIFKLPKSGLSGAIIF